MTTNEDRNSAARISENMLLGMPLLKQQTEGIALTEQQKLVVVEMLKEFKHFRGLIRQENCMDYFLAVIPFLSYVHVKHKDFVFHHSDRGGVFYFIMAGNASVFIPKLPEELDREILLNTSLQRAQKQLSQATAARDRNAIKKSNSPTANTTTTTTNNNFNNSERNSEENIVKNLQRTIHSIEAEIAEIQVKNNEQLLEKQMFRYTTREGRVCTFKQVNTLKSADSFGEVSIVTKNKLRTASIVASDENNDGLHMISIAGSDYIKIFDQELNRMNFTLKVLEQTFPLSSRDAIIRLSYEFKEIILDKGQIIFSEGSSSKHVYLIKSGEVELIKKKDPERDDETVSGLTSPKLSSSNLLLPIKRSGSARNLVTSTIVFALLGSEAFFGMEDQKIHSFTARSASANAVVFSISRSLMEDVGMLRMFKKKILEKRVFYQSRITKLNQFAREQSAELRKPHVLSMKEIMKVGTLNNGGGGGGGNASPTAVTTVGSEDTISDPYQMKVRQMEAERLPGISENSSEVHEQQQQQQQRVIVPKLQFKRVMKDFLEAKKVSEVLGYFLAEQNSDGSVNGKIAKTARIGREHETVNESEEKRFLQISEYNQMLLDTKTEQQNLRMQEYIQEEEAKLAKAKKASTLRTNRPQYADYLRGSSSTRSLSPEAKIKAIQHKIQISTNNVHPFKCSESAIGNGGAIISSSASSSSLQYQFQDQRAGQLIQNRPARVRSEWLQQQQQGIYHPEYDRIALNKLAQQHLLTRGGIPLSMKRQPNFSKLDSLKKSKRMIEFNTEGKLISNHEKLVACIPVQTSLPIIHSYFNKSGQ